MPPAQIGFNCALCLCVLPLAKCRLLHCYHGFCDACMGEWLKSNRIAQQKRFECPTCRKPALESDLGRMFVETVVLSEDAECETKKKRLVDTIMKQIDSVHGSVRTITPTSNAAQVNSAMLGVVRAQGVLSKSQQAKSEPMVNAVVEKLSGIADDLDSRVQPVFEKVTVQSQEIESLTAEIVRLKENLQSVGLEKLQVEWCLEDVLQAREQARENKDSFEPTAPQTLGSRQRVSSRSWLSRCML